MRNEIKNMKLAFTCSEDWDAMKEQENGRFCSQCSRIVKDFSNATTEDLKQEMEQSPEIICGHFKKSQMSPAFLKYAATTALIATLNGCTPENIKPATELEQPIEIIESGSDTTFVGIVIELPPDEETFHEDEIYQPPVIHVGEESPDQ